jgi:hypothetical protein
MRVWSAMIGATLPVIPIFVNDIVPNDLPNIQLLPMTNSPIL